MKIALPTNDGNNLSEHFGRSKGFLVYEIEQKEVVSRELRTNLPHSDHGSHGEGNNQHHSGMAALLHDCPLIICGGMGWRAAEALKAAGITPVMVKAGGSADEIVSRYLAGTLDTAEEGFCSCHH